MAKDLTFTASRADWLAAFGNAARVAHRKPSLPILETCLLEVVGEKLHVLATNLEETITTMIPIPGSGKPLEGKLACLPVHKVAQWLATLPGEVLSFKATAARASITSGESKLTISHFPTSEFPVLPKQHAEFVRIPDIREAIKRVAFAASADESRPVLTCVHIQCDGEQMTFEATDGFRLARTSVQVKGVDDFAALVPAKSLALVLAQTGELEMAVDARDEKNPRLTFRAGDTIIVVPQMQGSYPALDQIIPKSSSITLEAARKDIALALKQLGITSNLMVKMDIKKDAIELMSSEEDVTAQTIVASTSSGELQIALNSAYLAQGLAHIPDKALLGFKSAVEPVVVKPAGGNGYVYIQMPMHMGGS